MKTPSKKLALSSDFPIDLVEEILPRLPSKSLVRFRCVCKSWFKLITCSKFIELHRNQYNQNNNNGHILIENRDITSREPIFSLHCEHTYVEKMRFEQHPFPGVNVSVLGCSNGLVFLRYSEAKLVLWNPSIRKFKVLPDSLLSGGFPIFTAFGFVSRINDYRVVKMPLSNGSDSVLEIYSLSTNSWKLVENGTLRPKFGVLKYDLVFRNVVDGVVYIMVKDYHTRCLCILWFDMADEVFGKIEIQDYSPDHRICYHAWYPMVVSDKFVAVLGLCRIDGKTLSEDTKIDIWAMKKNGAAAAESWTKHTLDHHRLKPLGVLKNDEFVWHSWGAQYNNSRRSLLPLKPKLALYDPKVQEMKVLQFNGDPEHDFTTPSNFILCYKNPKAANESSISIEAKDDLVPNCTFKLEFQKFKAETHKWIHAFTSLP